jgi:WD40 repeat protein
MARSLRVSAQHLPKVKLAFQRKNFPSQKSLADKVLLGRDTVSKFFNGRLIDRINFEEICKELDLDWQEIVGCDREVSGKPDWGDAPDVSIFFGRDQELEELEELVLGDGTHPEENRCRLVTIVGIGGIGKTHVSVKLGKGGIGKTDLSLTLAREVQPDFERLIWRKLLAKPPITEILGDCIKCFSNQQQSDLPDTVDKQISLLLKYLRDHRCLMVLDNVESILNQTGGYEQGYEDYGKLFESIGEVSHQSCLLLTSRQRISNLQRLEGSQRPVRLYPLGGLKYEEAQELFQKIGDFRGSDDQWQELTKFYNGNPLALELAAQYIQETFGGDIAGFGQEEKPIFGKLEELLEWHLSRLSSSEKEVLYWLAIHQEAVAIAELKEDLVSPKAKQEVANTLRSLQCKLTLEKSEDGKRFSLQPVLIEHITQKLIEQVCQEIETGELELFNSHSLMQAQAKDYVRDSQSRTILEPIKQRLMDSLHGQQNLENHLTAILTNLREHSPRQRGYIGGNILNLFCQLNTDLEGYDFSSLSIWQADLRNIELHQINFSNSDLTKSAFRQPFGGVHSLSFTPDGKYLAVGDFNGETRILQVEDWQQIRLLSKHLWQTVASAVSPDSQKIVTSDLDGIIKLWDINTGECLWSQKSHKDWIWALSFHPNGEMIASGSDDATIKLWSLQGDCLEIIKGHASWVLSVAFSPDGKILASSSHDRTIKIWDVCTKSCLNTFIGSEGGIWTVAFSPDGKTLASCSTEKVIRLWDVQTGECVKKLHGHQKEIKVLAFSPDGKTIVSASFDKTVKFWDVATGACRATGLGHPSAIRTIAYSPNNKLVATGDHDQMLKIWNPQNGQCIKTLQGNTDAVWAVSYSPDGQTIASTYMDHKIRLWNAQTGELMRAWEAHPGWIWKVKFSPDGQTVASCADDETIKLWGVRTGNLLKTLVYPTDKYHGGVWAIAFSPDGKLLVSGGQDQDNTVKIWDIATGTVIKILNRHHGWIMGVAFSPDGKTVASACGDYTAKIWDVATGECVCTCEGHTNKVHSVAYSKDGKLILTGAEDSSMKLWNARTGECLHTFLGHEDDVVTVDFGDQGLIVSCSKDFTAKIWDLTSRECLQTFQGHTGIVYSVAFSPDSQTIVSGSLDATVKIWQVDTGECLRTLTVPRPYEGTNITGITGVTEGQKYALKSLGALI